MASKLNDILVADFQATVDNSVDRNRNILDILSKFESAASRFSRAMVKASTQCGCITVSGEKGQHQDYGIKGQLCESCADIVQQEMGDVLFYLAAACSATGLNLYDVLLKESKALSILGQFSLK